MAGSMYCEEGGVVGTHKGGGGGEGGSEEWGEARGESCWGRRVTGGTEGRPGESTGRRRKGGDTGATRGAGIFPKFAHRHREENARRAGLKICSIRSVRGTTRGVGRVAPVDPHVPGETGRLTRTRRWTEKFGMGTIVGGEGELWGKWVRGSR